MTRALWTEESRFAVKFSHMRGVTSILFSISLTIMLSACSGLAPAPATPTMIPINQLLPTATASPQPSATPTPPLATATLTPMPLARLCTPLQGKPLNQMSALVSNPFHPPPPGLDDPHAGVDLAIRLPDTEMALAGHPVQSAFAGKVVVTIDDRFPFGNALVIETPLDTFPADWWQPAEIPTPAPTLPSRSALTCPPAPEPAFADPARRSLYILYAHLEQPSKFRTGDAVACGQVIGTVGGTGNALNPHLHFETRVGPSGLQMTGMAHYHSSVTAEEMSNYCLWTVSGLFQVVDPLKVLQLAQ